MSEAKLRKKARELLQKGEVNQVIGYRQGYLPHSTTPAFVCKPEDVDVLVLNPFCYSNLAIYLTHKEIRKKGRPAIVAKTEDIRSIVVLVQEFQIKSDDLTILGFHCEKLGQADAVCTTYDAYTVEGYETLLNEKIKGTELKGETIEELAKLEGLTQEERFRFWQQEFARCNKCYACRQACPLCYCTRCIVEKTQPQWIEPSAHLRGNLAWNFIRAFHLAGRCVMCGACERACPMDIPLMLLNASLVREVEQNFAYLAGYDSKNLPPLVTFKPEDEAAFIR